ncbi:hypothetical protein Anapl_14572 [Anas platyrhynchos]|uniref:Uncharacterized protein n=1 Tax=Anas platyrhynchos TaxID=8839 RepID=R0JXG9_ANAPL|nr:hypothetical protein Anapl_14572 [Anas platyrhynchos]
MWRRTCLDTGTHLDMEAFMARAGSQCSTDEGCNTLVVQTPRWGYKSQQCRVLVLCAPVLCVLALSFLAWCFLVLCVLVLCIPVLCVLVLRVPVLCALVLRVLVLCVPVLCVPASLLPGFPILLLQVPAPFSPKTRAETMLQEKERAEQQAASRFARGAEQSPPKSP